MVIQNFKNVMLGASTIAVIATVIVAPLSGATAGIIANNINDKVKVSEQGKSADAKDKDLKICTFDDKELKAKSEVSGVECATSDDIESPVSENSKSDSDVSNPKVNGSVKATEAKTSEANDTKVAGNNGTIKVHEQGTPANTENNDPKVCTFNFEGFGFDNGQSGIITISTQGGGNDKSVVRSIDMPAANQDGYTETAYTTLENGHYKATVYGKDVNGNVDYDNDLKAKSKVFKVECEGHVNGDSNNGHTSSTSTVKATGKVLPATLPSTGISALASIVGALMTGTVAYGATLRRK